MKHNGRGTIFFVHGMWCTGAVWENYRQYFEERGYTCLTPDLRHHGPGPADPALGRTSLRDYVEDLEKEIRALPHPPVLVGHSMGGLLAQMLAARGLARAVILLAPGPPAGIWALRWPALKTFWSGLWQLAFLGKPFLPTRSEAEYGLLNRLPDQERRATYGRFVFESGRAAFEIGFWFLLPWRAAWVDEARVRCPLLIVGAAEDRVTPPVVVRKLQAKYRRVATYKEFPGHGHWVLSEPGWEEIARHCAVWLAATEEGNR